MEKTKKNQQARIEYQLNIDGLTIGSKVFIVHRAYAYQKKPGGSVIAAKVVSFRNISGSIEITFRTMGEKPFTLGMDYYLPFINIQVAIDAIKS